VTEGKVTILVVDDEEHVRNLLQRVLKEAGYDVVTAANGQEALDKVAELKPKALILDIKMPVMSGMEVLQQIAAKWPEVCVVMSTAVDDAQTAVDADEVWANAEKRDVSSRHPRRCRVPADAHAVDHVEP